MRLIEYFRNGLLNQNERSGGTLTPFDKFLQDSFEATSKIENPVLAAIVWTRPQPHMNPHPVNIYAHGFFYFPEVRKEAANYRNLYSIEDLHEIIPSATGLKAYRAYTTATYIMVASFTGEVSKYFSERGKVVIPQISFNATQINESHLRQMADECMKCNLPDLI